MAGAVDLDPMANPSWMQNEHSNRRLREMALGTSMYLNNANKPPLGPPPGFQPINQQQQYAAAAPEAPFEVESSCCILCCY